MRTKEDIIKQYNIIHEQFKSNDSGEFLNHGFYPPSLRLPEDMLQKNSASLYMTLLENIETTNLKILEIGCGRGAGANIMSTYYNFNEVHACDLNKVGIEYCKKKYPNINFKVSDAEALDYDSEYFDIVINVESSHCYSNLYKFKSEVHRVLKKSGKFLITDTDTIHGLRFYSFFKQNPMFNILLEKDITDNVLQSCKIDLSSWTKETPNDTTLVYTNLLTTKVKEYESGKSMYKFFVCEPIIK
jgi:ubiquinone/menaquinone biosynthesis C-methylase UbiE